MSEKKNKRHIFFLPIRSKNISKQVHISNQLLNRDEICLQFEPFFTVNLPFFNSSLYFSSETSSNWIRTQPSRIKPNHENKDSYSYDQKFIQIYHPKSRGFLSVDLDGDLSHTTSLNDNRSKSIGFILVLPTHSVELSEIFCHSDFT